MEGEQGAQTFTQSPYHIRTHHHGTIGSCVRVVAAAIHHRFSTGMGFRQRVLQLRAKLVRVSQIKRAKVREEGRKDQ